MCELFDYLLNKGEQKGLEEGIVEGKQSILDKVSQYVKEGLTSEELYQRLLSEQ